MTISDFTLGVIAGGVISKLVSSQRETKIIIASNQSESLAQQRVVQNLIDNHHYKLDDVDYLSGNGTRWTLSKI